MKLIGGIDIDRSYAPAEIVEMAEEGKLRGVTLQGYVSRFDMLEGRCRFVPWYEANHMTPGENSGGLRTFPGDDGLWDKMREQVEAEHPIVRRTPQERVASMMLRLMGDERNADAARNHVASLGQDKIQAIVGEAWRDGDPVTEDIVRRVVAHFLNVGEKENRAADARRVTRSHATA